VGTLRRWQAVPDMPDERSGTFTFLFTDIEGSTRLEGRLGARYKAILDEHRDLIRQAITDHEGREVDAHGDSFFVAFGRPIQAVTCAIEVQRALARHEWPSDAAVRVRMGINTGEALEVEDDYVGLAVNRAARICAAAHGGQVLTSHSTQMILEDAEPSTAFSLHEVGEHSLIGFDRPMRLFQVVAPGLASEFPALRTARTVSPPAHDWMARLNRRLGDKVEIKRLLELEPLLQISGPFELSAQEAEFAAANRVEYARVRHPNDRVAILAAEPIWQDNPVVIHAWHTDFAAFSAVEALRGSRPTLLSANVLAVCAETDEVVLHRRSFEASKDYPGRLHTFGGAYMPPPPTPG